MEHQFDAVIIGAGLAGLRAAIEIGANAGVALYSLRILHVFMSDYPDQSGLCRPGRSVESL